MKIFLIISLLLLTNVQAVFAEIRFMHDNKGVSLPANGAELRLSVSIAGTKRADFPLEVEVIKDSQLYQLIVPDAAYFIREQPTYIFSIASPAAGVGYRFKITDQNGDTWISDYYFLLQECESIPGLYTQPAIPSSTVEKVNAMAVKAGSLERELAAYTNAQRRLTELVEFFSDGD
jgi:hypothetical protein